MTSPHLTPELEAGSSIARQPQKWGPLLELPCDLTLDLPVPDFSVRDLLRLETGTVLETNWANGDDVPVRINGQLIAWAEFEVFGDHLAARVTEWA